MPNGETVNGYNYHVITTAQSNSTNAGVRYNRSLGANATQPGGRGGFGGGGGRRGGSQNQGLRQSINFNYNQGHSASDIVNFIPELGGKSASNSYSLQAGYTVGYHRFTSIFNANWNRSNSHTINFFTNTTNNPALADGINVPNNVPLNYGVPTISLSNGIQGLSDTQPSFSISQTISFSEVLSWIHGKHNMRFGGDYRRVHRDFLAGSNGTGNFAFTGLFTGEFMSGTAVAGTGSFDRRFSPRPAAIHHAQLLAGQELPARQRLRRLSPWTTGACCLRSHSITACAGSFLRPTRRNTAASPTSLPIPPQLICQRDRADRRPKRPALFARVSLAQGLCSRA